MIKEIKEMRNEKYRYFQDIDDQIWKVSIQKRQGRVANAVLSNGSQPAVAEVAVTVIVSPIGQDGKAIKEDGRAIVIDSLTHTFNGVEMSAPDFNPEERIEQIIADRINLGRCRLSGMKKLNKLFTQ